jgi:N-acylglucosamine 2-epimerase
MHTDLADSDSRAELADFYRSCLLDNCLPFWLRHGLDHHHGGIITSLDRDGAILDTDKSVWFQGRAAWMFATLYNTVEPRAEWLAAAQSCIEFLRRHCFSPAGKMYFVVSCSGQPLRMRRYVFSECFAAMANAAYARATGEARAADDAARLYATYLRYTWTPGVMPPKCEPTRPAKALVGPMMSIAIAQELRANLGDIRVSERKCTEWIDAGIAEIERDFVRPEHEAVLETVALDGSIMDHFDGRLLNPGHALEAAWFILHEGQLRADPRLVRLGLSMLDWMWQRGWDSEYGGLFYFRDLRDKPVQEYWHDMKFWWPHTEALIATLLAWRITGADQYAAWHRLVHDWSFRHFADEEYGEWFGYLHRDGSLSVPLKGNMWKGPFHLPRMLWYCSRALQPPL